MRVAVVSDVHGSLTALEAVVASIEREAPDAVVHGGDLALMGPQPAEVVDRIRELGWRGVVGNTDELLWRPEERERQLDRAPKLAPVIELLFDAYAPFTRDLLGADRIAWLRALPAELRVGGLAVVHAAPGDLWRAPLPDVDDAELARTYAGLGAASVGYGHIHRPFVRTVRPGLTVANSGSVGLPWDGDPRAAYLIAGEGEARIVRVEYDVEHEAALLAGSAHPDAERLAAMRRRGRFVAPA
jgi:predicted phosphodiesterase